MGRYRLQDPDVARLAQIIHDIEVNYWGAADAAESPAVEAAYRELQQRTKWGQVHYHRGTQTTRPAQIQRGEINLAPFCYEAIDRCCFGAVMMDIKLTLRSWMDHPFKISSPSL